MFKRKPKVLTPQEMEEIRTKDFFDCILPGTVKFLSDHYILGDNYWRIWWSMPTAYSASIRKSR